MTTANTNTNDSPVIFDMIEEKITTRMDESARFSGNFIQTAGIFFDGQGKGHFEATNATIIVGENAFIEGRVVGRRVFILGKVKGKIHADEHLVLGQTAQTEAAMHFATIDVRVGAKPGGQLLPHGVEAFGSPSLTAIATEEA